MKKEKELRQELEEKIEQDKPKILFADAVATSQTSILIGELAKLLRQNGVEIGQNRLFARLRENGYLIKRKGADWNLPTQKSMEAGLFEIKEWTINSPVPLFLRFPQGYYTGCELAFVICCRITIQIA